jgi:hypothetical protein
MGPAAHEPPGLIIQMRQFDLQPPFRGGGTLPKISRMRPVRSITLALSASSRFFC